MQSRSTIKPGRYLHYKGNEYQVFDTALHSETEEELVVYKPLYGDQKLWVRPIEMFLDTVIIDGVEIERFKFIES